MTINPYTANAKLLSEDDHQMLSFALETIIKAAGEDPAAARARALLAKLTHMRFLEKGDGLPEQLGQTYIERFQKAMDEQDHKSLVLTLNEWFAAVARTETDPASILAQQLTKISLKNMQGDFQVVNEIAANASIVFGQTILDTVVAKFDALLGRSGSWPKNWYQESHGAHRALKTMRDWIAHGRKHLSIEHNPWAGDEDVGEGQ